MAGKRAQTALLSVRRGETVEAMPFRRNPTTGRGEPNGPNSQVIPQVKWPPGYKDPPELLQMRDRYLVKWALEGKRITQFYHALALAAARRNYYKPTTFQEARRRKRSYDARHNPKVVAAALNAGRHAHAIMRKRREIKKQQAEQEAAGRPVRRQFFNSLSDI